MKTALKGILLASTIAVSIAGASALVFKSKEKLDSKRHDQALYTKRTINPGDV